MAHSVNIPDEWRSILADIFQTLAPDYEVWAYGSRVKGTHHEGSDLDLVLISEPKQAKHPPLADIKAALEASALPILVDVVDWQHIPEAFQEEINQHKVRLFPRLH